MEQNRTTLPCLAFHEDLGKYGYLDEQGEWVIYPIFDGGKDFSDNLAVVIINGEYKYITPGGQWAFEESFEEAGTFNNQLAKVKINGKWGYIDIQGVMQIPAVYDYASGFINRSYSIVTYDDKEGIIDRSGNWIVEPIYDLIYDYNFDGHLTVWNNNEEKGLIIPYAHTKPNFD